MREKCKSIFPDHLGVYKSHKKNDSLESDIDTFLNILLFFFNIVMS